MNISQKTLIYLLAAPLLLTASSCSFLESILHKDDTPRATELPQDREMIHSENCAKTFNPAELALGSVNGEWAIESVNDHKAVGEEAPYLRFAASQKRIYGNNGCNVINAKYACNPADSTMSFSDIASTMRLCNKEGITDYEINAALAATCRYTWQEQDSHYYLYLLDESGRTVMTLMHQNFQFLNGTWLVTSISGEAVNVPDMKLVIDVDEGKLHGYTGCNVLNGTLETDMRGPNSISFEGIVCTQALCPDKPYETPLIVALEEAVSAQPLSAVKVQLLDSQGKTVLTLERTSDQ